MRSNLTLFSLSTIVERDAYKLVPACQLRRVRFLRPPTDDVDAWKALEGEGKVALPLRSGCLPPSELSLQDLSLSKLSDYLSHSGGEAGT